MIHKLFSVVVLVTAGVCAAIPSPNRQDQGKDAISSNVAMPIRKNKFKGKVAANGEVLLKVDESNDFSHRVGANSTARKQVIPVRKHTFEGKVGADGETAISDEEKGSPSQDERHDREAREDELMVLEEEDSDTRAAPPKRRRITVTPPEGLPRRCLDYGSLGMMAICKKCVEGCPERRGNANTCFQGCMPPRRCHEYAERRYGPQSERERLMNKCKTCVEGCPKLRGPANRECFQECFWEDDGKA